MKLIIDGYPIEAKPNESLLDIIKKLGLVNGKLSTDPIVAKMAGEVFTLNYIPVRHKDVTPDSESLRKAVAASGGVVRLLRYCDNAGREAYMRTAQFILFSAMEQLWPKARAKMNCIVGAGLYITVSGAEDFSAERLKKRVEEIVAADVKLVRRKISTANAVGYYGAKGWTDKVKLLAYREKPTINVYDYDGFMEYYYGEMAPYTSYLRSWDILPAENGFLFVFPNAQSPDTVADYNEMPHYINVYTEGKRWGELMECETVADLNVMVDNGRIRELIRVNEALHEKRFSEIADMICERGAKAVMLSGPSSSGKTTSANRLATQLRVHGKKPVLMSLDDYYIDRDKIPLCEDGKPDLEHINAIDTALFGKQLRQLLEGWDVELPHFNFKTGKREWIGRRLKLEADSVIIVEGLHALNPMMLPEGMPSDAVFRMYVSPFLALNLDYHSRIPSSYLRLLRRIVRDFETRNSSVQETVSMWGSVRRGEEKWIFPFHSNADVILNSSTLYELAVLKKHIFPLLLAVQPEDEYYDEVRAIVKVLNFIHEADVDDEIPPTSLVREFIGGNAFYRK